MKTTLILASTVLCLSLAASSHAQRPDLTASRTGFIPNGGGVIGIQGAITNTSSQLLTITGDTITIITTAPASGSVSQDFITDGGSFTQTILPGASYFGQTGFADNRDMNNNPLPGNNTTPYLFTITYASSMPTDISQGTVQLSYRLGTDTTVFTDTFTFPAAPLTTPEPGTLALLGSGLVSSGLFLARRRRK